jgi:hypothetical protein
VTAPLRAVPIVGSTAAEFAKIVVAARGSIHPEFLTSEQQDLLQGLQRLAGTRDPIIIIDNIGWLDVDTAQLILNLDLPEIEAAYPFAKNSSILFIENVEATATLDKAILERLRPPEQIQVPRVSRADFPRVLKAFGLDIPVDTELLDAVYSVIHGHLEITKQIAVAPDQGSV